MIKKSVFTLLITLPAIGSLFMLSACTISPKGEARLRAEAQKEGRDYHAGAHRMASRPLPDKPNATQLISYALRHSPAVEAAYWKFRAAIEVIPQAGTEMTTPMLSGNLALNNGAASGANSSIGIANMGSSDIRWPAKPAADAKIALENARDAQRRFREAQFDLRRQVLQAWYGLITARALLHNAQLQLAVERTLEQNQRQHVEFATGAATGYLSLQNALTRIGIKLAQLKQSMASRQINLNSLLNRSPRRSLRTPSSLAFTNRHIPPLNRLIQLALEHNPNLRALHFTRLSRQIAIDRARMQYIPNFDLGAMSSLDGAMQNLAGAVMFPVVRYRAINAAIKQAQYRLFRTTSQTHQSRNDVVARLTNDAIAMHSDAEQLAYIHNGLLPRLHELRHFSSIALSQGNRGLTADLLATLSILHARELELLLRLDFANRQADIDALTAQPIRNQTSVAPAPSAVRHSSTGLCVRAPRPAFVVAGPQIPQPTSRGGPPSAGGNTAGNTPQRLHGHVDADLVAELEAVGHGFGRAIDANLDARHIMRFDSLGSASPENRTTRRATISVRGTCAFGPRASQTSNGFWVVRLWNRSAESWQTTPAGAKRQTSARAWFSDVIVPGTR